MRRSHQGWSLLLHPFSLTLPELCAQLRSPAIMWRVHPATPAIAGWWPRLERSLTAITAGRLALLVLVVGGALRLFQLNLPGLFLDERYTMAAAHLDWTSVAGLRGVYEVHPPLYYLLVKMVGLGGAQLVSARLLSWFAGTLTVALAYVLFRRLLGARTALVAELAIAIAPIHVAYSHIARQYALVTLLVVISYLLLLTYLDGGRRVALVGYVAAVVAGLYTDYSFVYAFLPQAGLCLWQWRKLRSRAITGVSGMLVAGLLFAPWIPNVGRTIAAVAGARAYLIPTPHNFANVLLSLSGLGQTYYYGAWATPWHLAPVLRPAYALLVLAVIVLGALQLYRGNREGLLAALLLLGMVAVCAVLSLISPGFVERTLIPATLGWAMLVGAAAFAPDLGRIGPVLVALLVVLTGLTIGAIVLTGLPSGEANDAVLVPR
jgi:4-amino-4-deoxy-L-arabinose transferase-like glycosyltransferase